MSLLLEYLFPLAKARILLRKANRSVARGAASGAAKGSVFITSGVAPLEACCLLA